MDEEDKLSSLPVDCLFQILSHFTPQELCTRISPLSKQFHSLARDPYLWSSLDMEPFSKFTLDRLTRILQVSNGTYSNHPNVGVKWLSLRGRDSLDFYEIIAIAPYLHALHYLDISYCYSFDEASSEVLSQCCPKLTCLIAKSCVSMNELALCHISNLRGLTCLKINNNSNLTDLAISTLAIGLVRLQKLCLKSIPQLMNSGLAILGRERYDTLRHVEIDGSSIANSGIESLVLSCPLLEGLIVHTASLLTDDSLRTISSFRNLKDLKLARCKKFTEDGFYNFFHVNQSEGLRALDFSECRAYTNYVNLEMCLRQGNNLKRLSLSFCWELDDDAFQAILNHCPNLKSLELAGLNRLTWTYVPEIPSKIPNLLYLDLRQCNTYIDDDIVKIVKAMPDLLAINFMGYEVYQKPGIGIIHSPRRFCE